ncbi:MAG TPA: hypothetical protein VNA16_11090 [Abditibacteriaceae bacterium]|nr:hypothetical protein [Abditibacteriaceae bacterium]
MNLDLHLRFAGALLIALSLAHLFFPRRFGWREELQNVSLLTRQIFYVHHFFVALMVGMQGVLCLCFAPTLRHPSPLSLLVLTGLLIFWALRLAFQFFVYDSRLWRGHAFNTRAHILFALLWLYLVGVFGWAVWHQSHYH